MPPFKFTPEKYPLVPGCYLMKDNRGDVLYVGKSKCLRRRLASYFRSHTKERRLRQLVKRIAEIEVILVNSETESLFLENNLIDHYRPPYNRLLWQVGRDYPYIALTRESFPRFVPYQKRYANVELGATPVAQRFGPYLTRRLRDAVLDFVCSAFQLRTCHPLPSHVCLRFHIHKCSGPCAQHVSAARYAQDVQKAVELLASNKLPDLVRKMKRQMHAHADNLEFERAQWLKEHIAVLERAIEAQVVDRNVEYDQGVIYFGDRQALSATIKRGALHRLELQTLNPAPADDAACAQFILSQYRSNSPKEIIVNRLGDARPVEASLANTNGYAVKVVLPNQDVARALMDLCRINYEYRASH